MKNSTQSIKNQVIDALVNYNAGTGTSEDMAQLLGLSEDREQEVSEIMGQFDREWNNVPCDSEGATAEQDKELDSILDDYAAQLLAL